MNSAILSVSGKEHKFSSTEIKLLINGTNSVANFFTEVWHKIKDFFFDHDKYEAKQVLAKILNTDSPEQTLDPELKGCILGKLTLFNTLKNMASEKDREYFVIHYNKDAKQFNLLIDGITITKIDHLDFYNSIYYDGRNFFNEFHLIIQDYGATQLRKTSKSQAPQTTSESQQQGKLTLLGAEDMHKYSVEFMEKHPDLVKALLDSDLPDHMQDLKTARAIQEITADYSISDRGTLAIKAQTLRKNDCAITINKMKTKNKDGNDVFENISIHKTDVTEYETAQDFRTRSTELLYRALLEVLEKNKQSV